ncbi:tRNA uridine-5-carboxymethylaminomethyl(34) synthesis GTPase MnmE [Marinicrinis sediminis]|uniref:tRNA modification GTPase MnmE n=1 Tax=Marinicrinis sediminis TaxID=1652465 RepID=A0ABW5RAZ2_9BACL
MISDTIAAIATAVGESSIAVIRVSGPDAIPIVDRVFRSKTALTEAQTHTIHYGKIIDPVSNEIIEEVLISLMRGPRSFTKEDVVEISCHGGMVSVRKVLELVLEHGARIAEPGEFTKRAFLNGRIDLAQAEAVMDLIRSKSDRAFGIAQKQSEGLLSRQIRELRQTLVATMAHIEVNIDYPEHDVEDLTNAFIREHCESALVEVDRLLKTAGQGKMLREGITTAIVGRPNVGKSSLMNTLTQESKAIVTDIPGTTRDVIEEYITINGIPLKLLDTAGIRETQDVVERIGVERSRSAIAQADLILMVLNYNEPLLEEELDLLQQMTHRPVLVIINKMDLPQQLRMEQLEDVVEADRLIRMSIKEDQGLQELEKAITDLFFEGRIESQDLTYVTNSRHIQLLKQARSALHDVIEGVEMLVPIDMIQIDVRRAWEFLGEIVGDSATESLLDEIFSKFCLGK